MNTYLTFNFKLSIIKQKNVQFIKLLTYLGLSPLVHRAKEDNNKDISNKYQSVM